MNYSKSAGSPSQLLLAEDDRAIRESLVLALELEGYKVTSVADGVGVMAHYAESVPDAMVLDVMMPEIDGLTACRRLRAGGDRTPILLLTARAEISDRVSGLDAGADDYLTKPFALDELLARVRALVRRARPDEPQQTMAVGDVRIDATTRRAYRGERELVLTKTEFDLLELLLRNPDRVLTHSTIYDRIWGYDFGADSKNLAVYVGYLRRKTEECGEPRVIQTVRGVGYALRVR